MIGLNMIGQYKRNETKVDRFDRTNFVHNWTGLDRIGLKWIDLVKFRQNWMVLDNIGQDRIGQH